VIEQFMADNSDFKKKIFVLVILIILAFFGWIFLNSCRITVTEQKVKAYELSQQQEAWLQNFDFEANQKLLSSTLDLVPLEEIEAVQRGQVEKFRQHNLNLVNIQNGIVKPKVVKKAKKNAKERQLDFVQSSATVTGSWDDFIACLNEFEKEHLVIITDCKLSNEKTGLIRADMRYRVYYE
jgi:hypothetical protein